MTTQPNQLKNKHAENLRAVSALLPYDTQTNYGKVIAAAADEIDRLTAIATLSLPLVCHDQLG